jgi:hypothetical protein
MMIDPTIRTAIFFEPTWNISRAYPSGSGLLRYVGCDCRILSAVNSRPGLSERRFSGSAWCNSSHARRHASGSPSTTRFAIHHCLDDAGPVADAQFARIGRQRTPQ